MSGSELYEGRARWMPSHLPGGLVLEFDPPLHVPAGHVARSRDGLPPPQDGAWYRIVADIGPIEEGGPAAAR